MIDLDGMFADLSRTFVACMCRRYFLDTGRKAVGVHIIDCSNYGWMNFKRWTSQCVVFSRLERFMLRNCIRHLNHLAFGLLFARSSSVCVCLVFSSLQAPRLVVVYDLAPEGISCCFVF